MLQVRRTFEGEKHQLQELNSRLAQYLSRTKQLEHENAHLIAEINKIRQTKSAQREHKYKDEVRELRRMVGQLSFEKSRAEMEREKLWREFQMIESLRRMETDTCKGVDGDLKSCEKELQGAHKHNVALEQRLFQLESEYKHLEDAHRQQIAHLRHQVDARTRVVPAVVVTQTYPAVSLEDHVQECAQSLSEGWIDTFEMYQQKVEEMEQSIRDDQARLDDLQREKMLHASEFNKLRAEVEQQSKIQMHLEEQLVNMQDNFRRDFNQYQMIIEELENERNMLADSIANKMHDYQHLLQVKMDLGKEVAAYRALLEGERVDMQEVNRRVNRNQRERIIDIKLPSQPYQPRASTSTRQHTDVRYSEHTSNLRRPPVPRSGTISPSRIIPIAVTGRALHQGSPASRRDMVSFTKAQTAASAAKATDKTMAQNRNGEGPQKKETEEKIVKITAASSQPFTKDTFRPITSPPAEPKVRVVPPPTLGFQNTEADGKSKVGDRPEEVCDVKGQESAKPKVDMGEKKQLDSPMVQEIIKNVMKPAGMDSAFSLSGDSPQMTYHVEKIEQEDGTTKTQIVLESKVEEEVDISEDSALEELLGRGVKKVSLEDIKGTATGSMIQNLLSGLQGAEDMVNKSVNVEIIEEPVDSQSDEEYEAEERSLPGSFQIEELENVPHDSKNQSIGGDSMKSSETNRASGQSGFVRVQESSRENVSPYYSHDQDEYFVSTPDENLSEAEDAGGITSYGHYGMVDDLSDERYYQDEGFPAETKDADEYKFMTTDHSFVRESIPECIIEEEVHVSPTVQESMLEMFKDHSSLNPKQQLKGALEKIQGSVSGSLKDELAFLTKVSDDSAQNVAVRNVQQSSDNGTTTIIAELSVSESLQESGLLEGDDDELSEEQIMAALRASHPGLQKAFQSGAEGGYSMRISKHEDVTHTESVPGISERHIQLGPSEAQSFTFQMDMNNGQAQASSERVLQSHMGDAPMKISHEKRVATVYLDSSTDE